MFPPLRKGSRGLVKVTDSLRCTDSDRGKTTAELGCIGLRVISLLP